MLIIENFAKSRLEKILLTSHNITIAVHRNGGIVLFKKVWTQHTKVKIGTPHCHFGVITCSLVKFPRVTLRPVSEILLVYCAREMEMCLIGKKKTQHL